MIFCLQKYNVFATNSGIYSGQTSVVDFSYNVECESIQQNEDFFGGS